MKEETKKQAATGVVTGVAGFLAGYFWPRKKQTGGGSGVSLSNLIVPTEARSGDTFAITVDATNESPNQQTVTIALQIANQPYSQNVTLAGGETRNILFTGIFLEDADDLIPDDSGYAIWLITASVNSLRSSTNYMGNQQN
jgi:hypothetical protein